MDVSALGRGLLVLGIVIVALGLILTFAGRLPLVGRLPGDVEIRGEGWTVYAPIATSIVLSLLITLALGLFGWLGGRR